MKPFPRLFRVLLLSFVWAGLFSGPARAGDDASKPLFNGRDFAGWKTPGDVAWAWSVKDGVIRGVSDEKAHGKELWTESGYGDFVLEVDWRFPDPPVKKMLKIILPNGDDALNPDGTKKKEEVLFGGDSGILIRGDVMSQINIVCKSTVRASSMAIGKRSRACRRKSGPLACRSSVPTIRPENGIISSSPPWANG